jgi:hypothetical protein
LVERGRLASIPLRTLERVAVALEADLGISVRWRGGDLDRLLDEGHATLVARAAGVVERAGWAILPEVTFAIYGDRGSIDLLGWHAPSSALLVVEVKTELASIEETLRTHDMKVRVAPRVAWERAGWRPRTVARLLVLPDTSTARRRVARHAAVLARRYPLGGSAARARLREPGGEAGLRLFLAPTIGARGRCGSVSRRRVRRAGVSGAERGVPAIAPHAGAKRVAAPLGRHSTRPGIVDDGIAGPGSQ